MQSKNNPGILLAHISTICGQPKVQMMFYEDPMMSYEVFMWLFIGFPWSWSVLCLALVVHRFPLVLILSLLGFGCAQVFPGTGVKKVSDQPKFL